MTSTNTPNTAITCESQVGGFSFDLIGKDLRPAETIIVKRQPERSDHACSVSY